MKLFIFVGFVWAAVVGPFSSVLILQSIGATSYQIGIFTAICAVISMVFQPVWGLVSDKIGSPRRVLCLCMGTSMVFFGSVLLTNDLFAAAGLMILDIVFRCGIIALLDSHTLSELSVIPRLQYGHIRMSGSIFYGALSFIYSGIINAQGPMAVIPVSIFVAAGAIIWGLFIAKGQWESEGNQGGHKQPGAVNVNKVKHNLKRETASLFRNNRYIVFIIFAAFSALATQPLFTFIIYYVTAVGGSSGDVPMIQALRCVIEIPIFILISSIGKQSSAKQLILTGMAFNLVYIVGLYFSNTLFWLTLFHVAGGAPGFILGLSGRMRYLSELTPLSVRSTSITVMGACEIGLGAIAGNLIAGFVLGIYGTQVLALVALAALFAAIIMLLLIPKKAPVN